MFQPLKMSVLGAAVALCVQTMPAASDVIERRITVTGQGSVESIPDMATITVGVTNEARVAKDAMSATSEAVGKMFERLGEFGIAQRDFQTQSLALNPIWSRRNNSDQSPPKIVGFSASNMVFIRIRDLDSLGEILDALITDGANDFNGLQFGIQEPKPLMDEARAAAVKDAIAKAELLANAAGVSLGPVMSISETGGNRPRPMMMDRAVMSEAAMPIASGEVSMSASVSVVFAIGQ